MIEGFSGRGWCGSWLECSLAEATLDEINHHLAVPEGGRGGEEKPRSGHIALVNVNNRIKLPFGEQYGLRISSIKGFGTRVEISLPVRQARAR